MQELNKIERQIFAEEFVRAEPERYRVKKIEWEWSLVAFFLWGSTFFVTILNLRYTELRGVVLLDWLILLVLLAIFVVLVGTISLDQEWKKRMIMKRAIEKAKADQYGRQNIESEADKYDLKNVYTDNKLDYILYKAGRYVLYGTTYLVLGAITLAIVFVAFSKPY